MFLSGIIGICKISKARFLEVTRARQVVWEYINLFFLSDPSLGGRIKMVHSAHSYGVDRPALKCKDLAPENYGNLNRLYT